jgi:hypothetical protein
MGQIPATGSEISMGRISQALGTTAGFPTAGANVGLNNTLGRNRSLATTVISNIASGATTSESSDFGGLDTPNAY